MKIKINEATASQLAEFAAVRFGLDVNHRMGADAIRAKLSMTGFTGDEIEVKDPEPVAETVKAAGAVARKLIPILIPTQNEPGGKDPVVVGVNGVVARIKRGVVVEVPEEYVHALQNAQRVQFDKDENGRPINPIMVPTHPFSIMTAAA